MDIQQFLNSGILEKYVLGLANAEEMEFVERMTKEHPEVNAHICKMQNCMEEYVEMHSIRPPSPLKKRFLKKLEGDKPNDEGTISDYQVPGMYKLGVGIGALMVLTLGVLSLILYNGQQDAFDEIALLSTQIKHLQTDQEALQTANKQIQQKNSVLKDVTTRQIKLKGSHHAPQALVVVYWNPDHSKGYLDVVNLPKCPKGNVYQMWADVNGKHVDMGLVEESDTLSILRNLPYINGCNGFVITMEKAGGSPHPNEEKVFANGTL